MIKKNDLKNKKIAVIGAGISGMALAELAKKLGADVFVSDANKLNIDAERLFVSLNIAWEENGNTEKLLEADEIVVSSGISPQNKMLKEARKRKVPIVGELDFVYPYLSGNIIGVTGSN
ncbi:MAG: UDP-N-acetylmuramoyl-L-alanine--D-glutamate ligase, partial [Synergistaceae bacterium]|nr:UDP-N-acetylmuramoyl-L-alanine--D-glutamate ligase [Synergistaceae bacterium]